MLNSFPPFSRLRIWVILGAALVIAAAAFIYTHLPVQLAAKPSWVVPVTALQARPAERQNQKVDLGAGYTLQTDASGTHIVAPETIVRSVPAAAAPALDLGAGYMLKDGQIVAPASNYRPAAATTQKLDLGAGYTLVTDTAGTRIVAPASQVKAQSSPVQKMDLGGGYWLITYPGGGQIVPEGSRNR
jgi:hypothetical protein